MEAEQYFNQTFHQSYTMFQNYSYVPEYPQEQYIYAPGTQDYCMSSPSSGTGSEYEEHVGSKPISRWKEKQMRLSLDTVVKRRRAANLRERKRMNGLNDAFEKLREHIPDLGAEKKLSKIETLQMAQSYIKALSILLQEEQSGNPSMQ